MKKNGRVVLGVGILIASTLSLAGCAAGSQSASATSNVVDAGVNQTAASADNNAAGTASTPNNVTENNSSSSSGGVNVASNSQGTTSVTPAATSSPFPKIVRMAMTQFPSQVLRGAFAPNMYPTADTGSNVLYYRTAQSIGPKMGFPGIGATYRVQFSSPHYVLADFYGARYDSSLHASSGFDSEIGDVATAQGVKSKVDLGHGHTGTLAVDQATSSASIYWTEGRWQIRVTQSQSTMAPIVTASQVVAYLETHFMPVPHDKAAIVVDLQASTKTVNVTWQNGDELFGIDTYTHCKDPVQTALAMAIAMRPYS